MPTTFTDTSKMSQLLQDAYIVAATRTPVGKAPHGVFRHTRPDELLVHTINAALAQVPTLDPNIIEDAIIGCAIPEAEQGLNIARSSVLLAGLPHTIAGTTVNRLCASSLTALAMAADRIRTGAADAIITGGVESMSMVPMTGNKLSPSPHIFEDKENIGIAYGMGLTAEKVAQRWKISREAQDQFAFESHQKALKAQANGSFSDEISPISIAEAFPDLKLGEIHHHARRVAADEGPRADTSLAALGKLKSVFAAAGSVTAGNSSQMSDGAGALVLVSEKILKQFNLTPLARFVSFAVRGVPPEVMGIGPIEAVPVALQAAGLKQYEIDWVELNEAFAAQSLAVIEQLKFDPSKINPLGGAIALGHPLGASGAIRATTVVHALRRQRLKYGMVTMCVGVGMGAAGIFERM